MPPPAPRAALIICPLAHEAGALRRALPTPTDIIVSGPGPDAIRACIHRLPHGDPRLVILAGLAGGLGSVADVPTIREVTDASGARFPLRPLLHAADAPVSLLGLDEPLTTPADKAAWHARSGADLVDTESHAFARACNDRSLTWTIIRGVSDSADEPLPPAVLRWVDTRGRTRPLRALLDLLASPRLIRDVARLSRRSARVLPLVAARVGAVAQAWSGPPDEHRPSEPVPPITPLPVPQGTPLVVFLGGTFDPPHLAHVELPRRARDELERRLGVVGRAWLLLVPAARSPHKAAGATAPDTHRLAMLRIALADTPRAALWTDELDRARPDEPSYTVDSLARARSALDQSGNPDASLCLLIGADQAGAFHRWREPRRILDLARVFVLPRAPVITPEQFVASLQATGAWTDEDLATWRGRFLDLGHLDAAATNVREILASGADPHSDLDHMLDPRVLGYIRSHAVYDAS